MPARRSSGLREALRREDDGGVREFQPGGAFRRGGARSPISRRRRSPSARRSSRRGGSATAKSMRLDAATRANLELFRSAAGGRAGSLLAAIDRTRTAAGVAAARRAAGEPALRPGADRGAARCGRVLPRAAGSSGRRSARRSPRVPDMLRALSRLGARARRTARPRRASAPGSKARATIAERLRDRRAWTTRGRVARAGRCACGAVPVALAETLARRAGRRSAAPEARRRFRARRATTQRLDEARGAARREPAGHRRRCRRAMPRRDRHPLAEDPAQQCARLFRRGDRGPGAGAAANGGAGKFIHRQTLASAMRFTTAELAELEQKIASAAERALAIELAIFDDLAGKVAAEEARDPRRRAGARRDRRGVGAGRAGGERKLRAAEGRREPRLRDRGRTASGRGAGARAEGRALSATIAIWARPLPLRERVRSGLGRTSGEAEPPHPPLAQREGTFSRKGRGALRRGGAHLAADRAEHGGEIDLPPAERADRDPRAGG